MALTYRTGSDGKGSALTIEELDNNFRYFTGSHPINGDLTITGSLTVSASANLIFDIDFFDLQITGGLEVSRDVTVGDDLRVIDDAIFNKNAYVGYGTGSTPTTDYMLTVTQSNESSGSALFDGPIAIKNLPTVEPAVSGQLWLSGSFSNSKYLMVRD